MQEWYNYINDNVHIQADLIGKCVFSYVAVFYHFYYLCFFFVSFSFSIFVNPVYLRTTPEVVFDRMKVRGRSEETSVSLDYLTQLHNLHEDWLIHGRRHRPAPVLVLNADLELEKINEEYLRSEESILRTSANKCVHIN